MKKAYYQIPLGVLTSTLEIVYQNDTLYGLSICRDLNIKKENSFESFPNKVYKQILQYLNKERKTFDINIKMEGTEFQMKVWKYLLSIPYGKVVQYKDVGSALNTKAYRAIGRACHDNKILIIVPCHRVIGANGKLTGYALGLDIKKELIELEKR